MSGINQNHKKMIFLYSLPRSGSTLVQRILAAHVDISTINEPHFLLPLFNAHKSDNAYSTYGHHYASWAVQDFIASLPNGNADYSNEIREFALSLYERATADEKTTYFLDKTPKYHFIAEDIINAFPDAKIIYLWRNPLAIVSSLVETWLNGRWDIYPYHVDLYQGLNNLIDTYTENQDRVIAIHYEDVILYPEKTLAEVFDYLELPFDPTVIDNFSSVKLKGRVTDPNTKLEEYQVLRQDPLHKWKKSYTNPLRKRWARQYLQWIGDERLSIMGYKLDELLAELDALPLSFRSFGSDIFWGAFGKVYHLLEMPLMRKKFSKWRNGERVYMYS